MTIASEVTRIQTNIANAYTACSDKGATMPDTQNSANLADTITSIPTGGGGGGDIPAGYNRIRFFDYDGTILSNQTVETGSPFTIPSNPSHQHMTFKYWNQDVDGSSADCSRDIGAIYYPSDNRHYVIKIVVDDNTGKTFTMGLGLSSGFDKVEGMYTTVGRTMSYSINYGDGSTEETGTHDGTITTDKPSYFFLEYFKHTHTYTTNGTYYVLITAQCTTSYAHQNYGRVGVHIGDYTGKVVYSMARIHYNLYENELSSIEEYFADSVCFSTSQSNSSYPLVLGKMRNLRAFCGGEQSTSGSKVCFNGVMGSINYDLYSILSDTKVKHVNGEEGLSLWGSNLSSASLGTRNNYTTFYISFTSSTLDELVLPSLPNSSYCYNISVYWSKLGKTIFDGQYGFLNHNSSSVYIRDSLVEWCDAFNYSSGIQIMGYSNNKYASEIIGDINISDHVQTLQIEGSYDSTPLPDDMRKLGIQASKVCTDSKVTSIGTFKCAKTPYVRGSIKVPILSGNLASGALSKLPNVEEIDISNLGGSTINGDNLFSSDLSLKNITFPDTSFTINKGYYMFHHTRSLRNLVFPACTISGDCKYMFSYTGAPIVDLSATTLSGVTTVENMFNYSDTSSIIFPDNFVFSTSVSNRNFLNYNKYIDHLVAEEVLKHFTELHDGFFANTELTQLALPNNITSIRASYGIFQNCPTITKVWMPATLTSIYSPYYYYSMFYNINGSSAPSVHIYCEATEKPSGWGTYWNYYTSSTPIPDSQIHWGATKAEYDAA